jgi:hypothetical protein
MSPHWAIRMHLDDVTTLGRLRKRSGIEVCERPDAIWVRAQEITDQLEADFRALPGSRFTVLADRQLVRFGNQVPQGYLPEEPWLALAKWLNVDVEQEGFSGAVQKKVPLQLVRGGPVAEANLLLTSLEGWQHHAIHAPQIRLDRWSFAINGDAQVVVRGTPLPPLPGVRLVERSGVAVEAGWMWTPSVEPKVLSQALGLETGDLAILHADETWDHLRQGDFVRATRSAVRLSAEALSRE